MRRNVEQGPPESGRGAPNLFRGSDLEGGRGRRAVPLRLISGRIPNLKLGPLLHLDSRPSGDLTLETRKGIDMKRRANDRLHGRIP